MDGWTNECPPVFYRTLSPSGPLPKKTQKTNNTYPTTFLSRGHATRTYCVIQLVCLSIGRWQKYNVCVFSLFRSGPPVRNWGEVNMALLKLASSNIFSYSELFSDISSYSELFFQCLNMFHHTPRERDRLIEPKTNKWINRQIYWYKDR